MSEGNEKMSTENDRMSGKNREIPENTFLETFWSPNIDLDIENNAFQVLKESGH